MGHGRRKLLPLWLVLAAAGALCAGSLLVGRGGTPSGPPPALDGGEAWNGTSLFLGDSITDFCDLSLYYPGLDAINEGVSGETTADILERMDRSVYAYEPDVLVLLAGVNDILSGVPDDAVTAGLEAIIAGIREHLPETAVLVQSIYPVAEGDDLWYTGHIRAVNERLEELAAGYGCRYVDVYGALCAADGRLDSRYSDDGLHPNDAGYRAACPLVAAAIRETDGR